MTALIPVEGAMLDRVLEATCPMWHDGLTRRAYCKFHLAQMKTRWGRCHQKRFALVEDADLLASATRYDLAGVLDGRRLRVCGIGAVFTEPAHLGQGHDRALIERLLDDAAHEGSEIALLFSETNAESSAGPRLPGFETIPTTEVGLEVAESSRRGAPMTMVRGGEERDLAAIVAMGQVRAEPFRFHLERDVDLVQHTITKKRLLAGLGPPGARQLQFFIAEEGITAAAYVVVSVAGNTWTVEECGDRDPSGARVGALLQALIAREPVERRPTIRAWLPPGFVPPQVTIVSATRSTEVISVRRLTSTVMQPPLAGDEVLYWRNDIF